MIATLYSPDCAGILGLGGSWLGARGCGSSDRVFSGRSCQVEFSLQSRLRRSCQALSPQPATRVRRGMPASIATLLAPRRGLDHQWLARRSFTRRSSCAFAATMMVDALIATAPTLMGNPQRTSRPPAIGMETRLCQHGIVICTLHTDCHACERFRLNRHLHALAFSVAGIRREVHAISHETCSTSFNRQAARRNGRRSTGI